MIIKIKNLRLKTIIGIYDWEASFQRDVVINAEIESDFEESCKSDNIKDTIDYDQLINKINNLVKNSRFNLIEKLAQSIINSIMEDKRIKRCKLELDKVKVIDCVDSFSITLEKTNGPKN